MICVMVRPRQPILTQARIVEVATTIIDSEGLEALSTRRLAAELAVRAPSLYNHFRTKEEILDAVGEAIIAKVDISMFGRLDWPDALRTWARGYRAALVAHPHIVPFLARGPGRRPAALGMADAVYGGLVDAGWPAGHATRICALMRYLVTGATLGSFAQGFVDDPAFYAERYPHLADAHRLREHSRRIDDGAFELGLETPVAGLVVQFRDLNRATATKPRR